MSVENKQFVEALLPTISATEAATVDWEDTQAVCETCVRVVMKLHMVENRDASGGFPGGTLNVPELLERAFDLYKLIQEKRSETLDGELKYLQIFGGQQTGGGGKRGSSCKPETLKQCTEKELVEEFATFDKQRTVLGNDFKSGKFSAKDLNQFMELYGRR